MYIIMRAKLLDTIQVIEPIYVDPGNVATFLDVRNIGRMF